MPRFFYLIQDFIQDDCLPPLTPPKTGGGLLAPLLDKEGLGVVDLTLPANFSQPPPVIMSKYHHTIYSYYKTVKS